MDVDSSDLRDEEGLLKHYDVIVYGTGLTESIVACAVARAGLSVLHLDQREYYGRENSTFPLDEITKECNQSKIDREWASVQCETNRFQCNSDDSSNVLVVDMFDAADIQVPTKPLPEPSEHDEGNESVVSPSDIAIGPLDPWSNAPIDVEKIEELKKKKRRFYIDFPSNGLIFGAGIVVESLLKSNVGNYLEFQNLESLFYITKNGEDIQQQNVPCTKGDVFQSTLLTTLEKRAMMKFMQTVIDWGHAVEEGQELTTLNEIDLAQGRMLHRPQNKDASQVTTSLSEHYDKPFPEFLKKYSLSPKLQSIVYHALCLLSKPMNTDGQNITTLEGLKSIYRHVSSLGRFGDGAFLQPLYGIGEVAQAFCRMAAVWGAVYMLRRAVVEVKQTEEFGTKRVPKVIEETQENKSEVQFDTCPSESKRLLVKDSTGKEFTCDNFVCNCNDFCASTSFTLPSTLPNRKHCTRFILSHICIVDKAIFSKSRAMAIIPPMTCDGLNKNAVFVLQNDSSLNIVPDGFISLSIHTEIDWVVDSAMSTEESESNMKTHCRQLLSSILSTLQASLNNSEYRITRLFYVTTIRPIYDGCEQEVPSNLFVCNSKDFSVSIHSHFESAKHIFAQILPEFEFLRSFKGDCNIDNEDENGGNAVFDTETEQDFRVLETALKSMEVTTTTTDESSNGDGNGGEGNDNNSVETTEASCSSTVVNTQSSAETNES